MLHHRLKYGIRVIREYERSIPPICANGSELNQVWTNLIDNAIDAMDGRGELVVRTAHEFGRLPGGDTRQRAWNPERNPQPDLRTVSSPRSQSERGTGLGLDTVYRIVQQHRGEVRVESQPGLTSFQVRLPFAGGK